jgi:hypothetical protein
MMQAREAKRKCPTCMSEHAYCPLQQNPRVQDRYCNARAIFCSVAVPSVSKITLNLPWWRSPGGHLVYERFQEIEKSREAKKKAVEVLRKSVKRPDGNPNRGGEEMDMETLQRLAMFGGMAGMGPPGPEVFHHSCRRLRIFGPEMARSLFAGGLPNFQGFQGTWATKMMMDRRDYIEDYDEDEEEDMTMMMTSPALLNRDGTTAGELQQLRKLGLRLRYQRPDLRCSCRCCGRCYACHYACCYSCGCC